eukprot:1025619-Prymnesium_polylepis.1
MTPHMRSFVGTPGRGTTTKRTRRSMRLAAPSSRRPGHCASRQSWSGGGQPGHRPHSPPPPPFAVPARATRRPEPAESGNASPTCARRL